MFRLAGSFGEVVPERAELGKWAGWRSGSKGDPTQAQTPASAETETVRIRQYCCFGPHFLQMLCCVVILEHVSVLPEAFGCYELSAVVSQRGHIDMPPVQAFEFNLSLMTHDASTPDALNRREM